MDAGDYRKADMSATLLDYRSATHDDYRRDPSARPEREQRRALARQSLTATACR